MKAFHNYFAGKSILVTGATGFKGSWLSAWLVALGARVTGFSLDTPTEPSLFVCSGLDQKIQDIRGDVRDLEAITRVVAETGPEIVFHLAAQPLVRQSYLQPVETLETNFMGTVHLLEAVRKCSSVKACICVTSDKCYENREWPHAYRESDPMGGHDPYSVSKGCAELVVEAYRRSFFSDGAMGRTVGVATVRAGNVIGGGDWAQDRLVPDAVRALGDHRPIDVRNPVSLRPWQFVLEPLSGYLHLAVRLCEDPHLFSSAWNFGPSMEESVPVKELAERLCKVWGEGSVRLASPEPAKPALHEAGLLKLDCSKSLLLLGWKSTLGIDETIRLTTEWYRRYYRDSGFVPWDFSLMQIQEYCDLARGKGAIWLSA